jgi:hypothetical protein
MNPLDGATLVLVDANNFLHAVRRANAAMPMATVIGRIRGAIPLEVRVELVFDGPPDRGLRGERIAGGLTIRYAAPRSADDVLLASVDQAHDRGGALATAGLLVITDDRDLRITLSSRGARTAGTAWLLARVERSRLTAPSIGNARPPIVADRQPTSRKRSRRA